MYILNLLLIGFLVFYLIFVTYWIASKMERIEKLVDTGNKDQQEIKTRLTGLRKRDDHNRGIMNEIHRKVVGRKRNKR